MATQSCVKFHATPKSKIKPFERTTRQWEKITAILEDQDSRSQNPYDFLLQPQAMALVQKLQRQAREQRLAPETLYNLQDDLKRLGNAVALYPLVLEDRLELVLVSADQPPIRRRVPVRRIPLNYAIEGFRQALRDPTLDPRPDARQLYRWLIEPLEDELKDAETILYAGDGQLRYVPLSALYDGSNWLVERFRINNITAASVTDFSKERNRPLKILAGAFSDKKKTYQIKIGDLPAMSLQGLQFAGVEVDTISKLFPDTTSKVINEQFNKQSVIPNMQDYDILHFATHATFVTGYPEESFVLLGDGDRINLREMSEWQLPNAALVVLSACETAVSGILGNGEELLGFGYQIQRTGAKASLSSLWKVNDQGTQSLMGFFYSVLRTTNVSKAEALRRAQVALIRDDVSILQRGITRDGSPTQGSSRWLNSLIRPFVALWRWLTQLFGHQPTVVVILPLTDGLTDMLHSSMPIENAAIAPGDRSGLSLTNIFGTDRTRKLGVGDPQLAGAKHPYYWAPFILLGNGL
ncbi:MAG: CHAT domain-containing protein [Cyanobacteria bacterium P01_A01_bin.105]